MDDNQQGQPDHEPKPDPGQDEPMAPDGQLHDAWTQLDRDDREMYVLRMISQGRHLSVCRQPHDDGLLDLMAAVRAMREDDINGLAVILRYGQSGVMLINAIKLLAEVANDQRLSSEFLTVWSSYALDRG